MPKRTDFPKERRTRGRSLTAAIEKLEELIKPFAEQSGVDLQSALSEAAVRHAEDRRQLAERLQDSVVPLFIADDEGRPDRIGSCVLVRLGSEHFAFTAAHVIRDAGPSPLWAPSEGRGGTLMKLPPCTGYLTPSRNPKDLDVGVLRLPRRNLRAFEHHTFLSGKEIDQNDQPDDGRLDSFYFVLGYSASRTQVKVSAVTRQIDQKSFHCETHPVTPAEYEQEDLPQSDHLLLDFDHKEIVVQRRRLNPPKLHGVSGGGVFRISRSSNQGPLVAIATQHRRNSRLIVATRLRHFLTVVRGL